MTRLRFEESDFAEAGLPAPGCYPATIRSARLRKSARGNVMVEVVHALQDAGPAPVHVTDYFVLEGAGLRGLAVARHRLVELYRACGIQPRSGAAIEPADLEGAELTVKVTLEERDGQTRLRVLGYRPIETLPDDGVPF
jgi:hypothetical protein